MLMRKTDYFMSMSFWREPSSFFPLLFKEGRRGGFPHIVRAGLKPAPTRLFRSVAPPPLEKGRIMAKKTAENIIAAAVVL